jgi:hypothetical protein
MPRVIRLLRRTTCSELYSKPRVVAPLQAHSAADKARLCSWVALGAGLVLGCVPKTEAVADLLDGAHSYVEFPGQRLLSGRLSAFGLDRSDAGTVALGLRDGRLVIAPFEGGSECDAGPAASVASSQYYRLRVNASQPKVPFLETRDSGGRGPLKFTDHHCSVVPMEPLQDAVLPLNDGIDASLSRYLVLGEGLEPPLSGFRRLYECLPWLATPGCLPLAEVSRLEFTQKAAWSIELDRDPENVQALGALANSLVRRGSSAGFTEFAYGVTELAIQRADDQVAFIDSRGLLVIDGRGLGLPEQIETDACSLHASRGLLRSTAFSYRAPCDSGALVVYDPKTKQRVELAGSGQPPALVTPDYFSDRLAFYLSEAVAPPSGTNDRLRYYSAETAVPHLAGTLWAERLGSGLPVRGPERALLASVVWTGREALAIADFDGTTGRYVRWNVDSGELFEIAQGVVDFDFGWVLSDFDGTAGTLRQLFPDFSSGVLAYGVPDRGSQPLFQGSCLVASCNSELLSNTIKWAVLSEYDGETGTLLLFTRPADGPGYGQPELIERNIPAGGYGLLHEGDALLYLKDYSASTGSGELNARFVRTADTFAVPNVDRFYETSSPDPAILYSVPDGPKAGIWYARLR